MGRDVAPIFRQLNNDNYSNALTNLSEKALKLV